MLRLRPICSPLAIAARTARPFSTRSSANSRQRNVSGLYYVSAVVVSFVGLSYAAVPLYKLFCQATGFAGTPKTGHGSGNVNTLTGKVEHGRTIRVTFNADVSDRLEWTFRPQQKELRLVAGETALAFYTAKNLTDRDITGIASYNITPDKAGQYFNKVQCFCFEYQRLKAHEEVDMPVFFYIDPEFESDPRLSDVDTIVLSYTFFEAKEGSNLLNYGPSKVPSTSQ